MHNIYTRFKLLILSIILSTFFVCKTYAIATDMPEPVLNKHNKVVLHSTASPSLLDNIFNFFIPKKSYFKTLYLPRSVSTSFNYITNFGNASQWDSQAFDSQKISAGDIGVGSIFTIKAGIQGIFELPMPYTITAYIKNRYAVYEGQAGPFIYKDTLRFKPYGLGTRLEYTAEISFAGVLAIFNPLLQLVWQSIGDKAIAGMPEALLTHTTDDGPSQAQIDSTIAQLFSNQSPILSSYEKKFLAKLNKMANNLDYYTQGIQQFNSPSSDAAEHIKNLMRTRLKEVEALAREHYSNAPLANLINIEDRTLLARNTYLLMSYYYFTQKIPQFFWTKFASFAANEVRRGIVLSLSFEHLLNTLNLAIPKELADIDLVALTRHVAHSLVDGQLNVFYDIASLALMDKLYGADTMQKQTWLSPYALHAYTLQAQAEAALHNGDTAAYLKLRTLAAVEFGAHEQLNTLQSMWYIPVLNLFSKLNNIVLEISDNQLALTQPNIYLGENEYREKSFGPVIIAPKHATDLTVGEYRVDIARNGFLTLSELLQDPLHALWIDSAQASLAQGQHLYQPLGIEWMPFTF